MAAKMEEPIFHLRRWVNGGIAISVNKSYSHMIYGARLTSILMDREPDQESDSDLVLAQ